MMKISKSNDYLNKGNHDDYSEYPLSKLIEIALRFIELHYTIEGHPEKYSTYNRYNTKLYGDEGYFSHWCNI